MWATIKVTQDQFDNCSQICKTKKRRKTEMIPTIESLKTAYDACKEVRKQLSEIEPIDELHRVHIRIALQKVDEIENELKVGINGRCV